MNSVTRQIALACVGLLVTGYALFGRSFAYLAIGPAFVGEIALALCLGCMAFSGASAPALRSRVVMAYSAFALWGSMLVARDFSAYGVDAIRDSALWYYGLFMCVCVWLFRDRRSIAGAVRWVARMAQWLPLWIPIAYTLAMHFEASLPLVPGSEVPVLTFKGGDVAVLLALTLTFSLACSSRGVAVRRRIPLWAVLAFSALDFVLIATKNRGGLVAIAVAAVVVTAVRPNARVMQVAVIGVCVVALFGMLNVRIPLDDGRELSAAQLGENVSSVLAQRTAGIDHSTAGWRLAFWRSIVDDTVHGDRFWTGNGFGPNLADRYGFQVNEDGSLRSPHNATITVLARMGVPGLALWLTLNATYAAMVAAALRRSLVERNHFWISVFLLLVVHWGASMVNASFDPYLEGPQGAILFWCGLGVGVAAAHEFAKRPTVVRTERRQELSGRRPHSGGSRPGTARAPFSTIYTR